MTLASSWRGRWLVLAVAVMLVVAAAAAASCGSRDAESVVSQQDCSLVEGLANDWISTQAAVQQEMEQGRGEPSDYRAIAEREETMAAKLRTGADSAASPEIKEQLGKWADGAALFAKTQRDVAERPPGTRPAPSAQSDFINASTTANDASIALGKLCPNMPTGKSGN